MRIFITVTELDGSISMYSINKELIELRFLNSTSLIDQWNNDINFSIVQGFSDDDAPNIIPTGIIADAEEGAIIDVYIKDVVSIHLQYEMVTNAPEHKTIWENSDFPIYSLDLKFKKVKW